jgi:RNA polymerase sigma factor (sigma-70 family)
VPDIGDPPQDFALFFERNIADLVTLARALGSDDPENVAQEAVARLFAKRGSLRDASADLAYARSVVCNLTRSRFRHLTTATRARHLLVPTAPTMPQESAEFADERTRLLAQLHGLPRRQREVLVLRYWAELSERDIAHALNIGTGSVKTHAVRGLRTLRQQMEEN